MDPKRWQRVQSLFESAVKRRPDELASWLGEVCGDDTALQREVEDLLRSDAEAGSFIETAIRGVARRADEDRSPLLPRFGKYEVESKIGQGGFGIVYRGQDPVLKRRVALKTCSTENRDLRRRFFREGRIAAGLQHVNITTVHDLGVEQGIPYLVQEFLEGEDLDHIIERRDDLPLRSRLEILKQVAKGLEYAHQAGVLHRDIKPANIRVMANGAVKIMDFGIAKLLGDDTRLTGTGMAMGTAGYLAPEQLRGESIDTRADVFAFGVLAYELLSYQRPFQGENFSQVSYQLLYVEPPALEEAWPECPATLARLVGCCLEKQPALRFMTLTEVLEELEPMVDALRDGVASAELDGTVVGSRLLSRFGDQLEEVGRPQAWRGWTLGLAAGVAVVALVVLPLRWQRDSAAFVEPEGPPPGAAVSGSIVSGSIESGSTVSEVVAAKDRVTNLEPLPSREATAEGDPSVDQPEAEPDLASTTVPVPSTDPVSPQQLAEGPSSGFESELVAGALVPSMLMSSSESPAPVHEVSAMPVTELAEAAPASRPGEREPLQTNDPEPSSASSRLANSPEWTGESEPVMKRGDLITPGAGVVMPRLLERPQPSYPQSARRRGREDRVSVRVLVDENGRVLQAVAPSDRLGFAASAKEAAVRANFEPATRDGIAGKMWTEIVFEFKLKS